MPRFAVRVLWLLTGCLVAAVVLRGCVVQTYAIPSESMEPTLKVGDRIVADRATLRWRDVRRGEVVVFDGTGTFVAKAETTLGEQVLGLLGLRPDRETTFVKRVIGVAGDRVRCCDDQGRVLVNSVAIDESDYLYAGDVPSRTVFDVIVPPRKLWVLGDHRSQSADSRQHLGDPGGGLVPESKVIGLVRAIVWPSERIGRVAAATSLTDVSRGEQ